MNITSKRGSLDNVVTYEHYCDEKKDLSNIPQDQITLGSIAIVLKDDGDVMCIYMANSNKEWIPLGSGGGGSDMSNVSLANLIDVSLTNPADGDTLVYNSANQKWIAQANNNTSNFMIVYASYDGEQLAPFYKVSINVDKTYEEISNHLINGGYVVCCLTLNTYNMSYYLTRVTYMQNNSITFADDNITINAQDRTVNGITRTSVIISENENSLIINEFDI